MTLILDNHALDNIGSDILIIAGNSFNSFVAAGIFVIGDTNSSELFSTGSSPHVQ